MIATEVQTARAVLPLRERLRAVKTLRHAIARRASELALNDEMLTAEVLPLLEACRFLERHAASILAPSKPSNEGRPLWLHGVEVEIHREPLGVVLIIGPSNYKLFLAAVQAVQAVVAGNTVLVKPGRGAAPVLRRFAECFPLPAGVLQILDEDPRAAEDAIEAGVDKVVFTGSSDVGMAVMKQLAARGTPAVMELSGHDPVFVLPGADLGLVARAVRFGTTLNGGNTCIAPKQVFAPRDFVPLLRERITIPVYKDTDALERANESGYALGASVFGPENKAREFARQIRAGVVTINDIIAPTADPRVPFGGRGKSGYGVTRGAEGLLEMTAPKAVVVRRTKWLPHLDPQPAGARELFLNYIALSHGESIGERLKAVAGLVRAAMRKG